MAFYSTKQEDLLFDAARKGDVEYLKQVISEGADINSKDARGYTPLISLLYSKSYQGNSIDGRRLQSLSLDGKFQQQVVNF